MCIRDSNIGIRGGSKNTKVYTNFSLFDQEGLIPGSDFKRLTARINLTQTVNDKTSLGLNALITNREQNNESGNLDWIVLPPIAKAFDENNEIIRYPLGLSDATIYSPLWNMRESTNISEANNFKINATLNLSLIHI